MSSQKIVVDANIIFSAIIKDSTTRYLIGHSEDIELVTPSFIVLEILNHLDEFSKRFEVKKHYLQKLADKIFELGEIKIIEPAFYSEYEQQALELINDPKDSSYLALALKLNCPIWSNDKDFKKQNRIKVYSTQELLKELVK
ncbi:MAG: PIN domain-containing protein [archaeon]|nr:PIN domain-containing protein [archaeon]